MTSIVERRNRRRARWIVAGIVTVVVAVAVAIVLVVARDISTPTLFRHQVARIARSTSQASGPWDLSAERALASRPMVVFPPDVAQPHPLTAATAGPPIELPTPTSVRDGWIPSGFPANAAGALGQLRMLDQSGLSGGDPSVYARVYRALSLPGAPDPAATGLSSALTSFRASGGLPDAGPVANLSAGYQVTEGLIKGTTDGGRFAVVCVLGELTVENEGQTASAGLGDCQAMRWTGADWLISPGVLAAPAPCAWPGSAESVEAGYRELS